MKAKLLKKIRSDERFVLERIGHFEDYPNSGWWYVSDTRLNRRVRHKKMRNVLEWLSNVYIIQFNLRVIKFIFFSFLALIIATTLISCDNKAEPRQEVFYYEAGDDTLFVIDSQEYNILKILDSSSLSRK